MVAIAESDIYDLFARRPVTRTCCAVQRRIVPLPRAGCCRVLRDPAGTGTRQHRRCRRKANSRSAGHGGAGAADRYLVRMRWTIEQVLRSLKSHGLRIEDSQMEEPLLSPNSR